MKRMIKSSEDTVREFGPHTTWKDVENMTVAEAINILSKYAKTDGNDWSARPHMSKACQMAIEALKKEL